LNRISLHAGGIFGFFHNSREIFFKLRWVTHKTKVTAEDVRKARHSFHGWAFQEIKVLLEKQTVPVLQYFDEETEKWVDVPSILEYRD